jgi:hypothetical protein
MEGMKRLEELGVEQISKDTHISQATVQLILDKSFDRLQKVQFLGFITILEREYKIDLSALKQEYLFHHAQSQETEDEYELVEKTERKRLTKKQLFITAAVPLVLVAIVFAIFSSEKSKPKVEIEINNTAIDEAKKNLNIVSVDRNLSAGTEQDVFVVESAEHGQDENITAEAPRIEEQKAVPVAERTPAKEQVASIVPTMPSHLVIVPKGKLWIGLIDLGTYKRQQMVISEPLTLDAQKEWLIITGHGLVRMEYGDTESDFNKRDKLMFLYENGLLQQIDEVEFKARNKGRLW